MAAYKLITDDRVRFLDLAMGTKWGKTLFAAIWLGSRSWSGPIGVRRWVAPIYKQVKIGFRTMKEMMAPLGVQFREGDFEACFPNDSIIQFRSADDPDSLAGEGILDVVHDEAARQKEYAWDVSRTTLTRTRGKAVRIGTPKGRNWFWRNWCAGQDSQVKHQRSLQCPTWDNPFIDPEEIEIAKRDLPEMIFRQEYGAEFVDDADICFPNFRACLRPKSELFKPQDRDHRYVAGLDLAKHRDYTVLSIFDRDTTPFTQVALDRFHKMTWPQIQSRVVAKCTPYQPIDVLMDSTGVGDPVFDQFRVRGAMPKGIRMRPYRFTSRSKEDLVENHQLMIDQEKVLLADVPEQVNEYNAFSYEYNHKTRNITYSAPEGMHDDIVMANALAGMLLKRRPLVAAMEGGVY